ncbi:MAG: glycosyltransferase family 2 protein [Candidatus ainarchaeum sp.]|nr:glycosyltransferase family 2 protein [Candidatus ainarchaeum sp.]
MKGKKGGKEAGWHIIIYVPAFNAEATVEELVRRTKKAGDGLGRIGASIDSMIIVNDGSRDGTMAALGRLGKEAGFLHVIDMGENGGPVKALFRGMEEAVKILKEKGLPPERTIMIRMDSDLEHQPEDIGMLVKPIMDGKRKVTVGYLPSGGGNGIAARLFNEFVGKNESKRFLGVSIPQFCPGFNAMRADLFGKAYPQLREMAERFREKSGMELLTMDFVILVVAKRLGEQPGAFRLRPVEGRYAKKPRKGKVLHYWNYHNKTMRFLEEGVR